MAAPTIVIFGITGDLSKRKLLPTLYHLLSEGLLSKDTRIIGVSRHELDIDKLLDTVELCVLEKEDVCSPEGMARMRSALSSFKLEPTVEHDYQELGKLLTSFDGDGLRERLLYMAVPPAAYTPILERLAKHSLNDDRTRLLIEKPFGSDYASATDLVRDVAKHFKESQIYRIDHYLAKETAQNLLAFRLHNPIFAPLWRSEHIERVHIRAAEKIGIEGRGAFYEQIGALRDLIQSHLLQLLALTLMDVPPDMTSEAIHLSKEHFLEQLISSDPALAIRGQYDGYRQEVSNPESNVETYALIHLKHAAERWQGTDIILETGKGLDEKSTTISIEFKTPHERRRNSLTFRIQPHEGIELDLVVKQPGFENTMRHESLSFEYDQSFKDDQHIDAYERVLMDAVRGDRSLFASDREIIATWRVLEPVIQAWQEGGDNLLTYPIGSEGPV